MASTEFTGSTAYDALVDKICGKNEEDWGEIMNFCDKVSTDGGKGYKEALGAITKKLANPNGKVAGHGVTLLRACFNNGGQGFQTECAQAPLMDEIYRLLQIKANTAYQVCEALKDMLQDWVLDHGSSPAYARITATYHKLKGEGFSFPATTRPVPSVPSAGGGDALSAREEEDLARAIAESLKDAPTARKAARKSSSSSKRRSSTSATNNNEVHGERKRVVRALYTFEVQEAGELGFKAGDMITLLSDDHPDWWKGELNGATGLFPSNYVEALVDAAADTGPKIGTGDGSGDGAGVVDELLDRLLTAQTGPTDMAFNAEIERLYDIVVGTIQPAAQSRLRSLGAKETELAQLNESLCTTMALYDRLHAESQLAYQGQPHP